jgi:hypothetical protein
MGDEHRVVLVQHRAVALEEAEQVRHLLEVGQNIRVVLGEIRVVELDEDDVLDRPLRRLQLASGGRDDAVGSASGGGGCSDAGNEEREQGSHASCRHESPLLSIPVGGRFPCRPTLITRFGRQGNKAVSDRWTS